MAVAGANNKGIWRHFTPNRPERWRDALDAPTIAAWLGIVVTAGGAVAGAIKLAFWTFDAWQKRRTHEGFSAPTDTLRFALQPEGACWWSMGRRGDEPIMQIVGRAFARSLSAAACARLCPR